MNETNFNRPRASAPQVLIADFDVFSTIGGGQTFFTKLIQSNPALDFTFLSHGEDISKKVAGALPPNALPIRLAGDAEIAPYHGRPARQWFSRHQELQALRIARSVAGRHFDVVDVPSFVPLGSLLRKAFALFNVTTDRVFLSLLGWLSIGIRNSYEAADIEDLIISATMLEDDCIRAANGYYTISDLHRLENTSRVDGPIEVIDMHNILDRPNISGITIELPVKPDLWFIGRLDRNKGPDLFIEVISRVPSHLYRYCRVSGPNNDVPNGQTWLDILKSEATRLRVDFSYEGALPTPALRSRALDGRSIIIIPSRSDSFNYVALEAIASGTPILLSTAAGAAGFLRDRHPELPLMTMDPQDTDGAALILTKFLSDYSTLLKEFRSKVASLDWPEVIPNFMRSVYFGAIREERRVTGRSPYIRPEEFSTTKPAVASVVEAVLTIIVPTYRRPEWLDRCLAGLVDGDLRRTRILVIDDGSPPEMQIPAIVSDYRPYADAVSIKNGGEANAVNIGLQSAATPFVMILSDDDAIEPSWPEVGLAAIEASGAVAVFPDWDIIDASDRLVEEHRLVEYSSERLIGDHWCLPGPATIFRRLDALAAGGRNPGIRFVSDYDFWLRLDLHGALQHVAHLGGHWRLHQSNATLARSHQLASEHVEVMKAHLNQRAEMGRPVPTALRRRAIATAHLAAAVILTRDGDSASANRHFRAALWFHPLVVRRPPINLRTYPQFYPKWLRRLLWPTVR